MTETPLTDPPPDPLYSIELMVNDNYLQGRIRASVAKESAYGSIQKQEDPVQSAWLNRYEIAVAPGWGAAYQYALDNGNPAPGRDPAVITDGMIQGQVQSVFAIPEPLPEIDNALPA